ncbi:MAG: ATP-binding protein [Muribaculaceae bacterium]|nr:ATP-binding protein [Muribaculaceae bacterium]
MKDLKAIRGKDLLQRLIAEGEHERQDFKFAIGDARKIARSLSAFANNSGGKLLIGVKDNGVIAGVRNEEDIYVVELAAERYCAPPQAISFSAYRTEGSVRVIIAEIAPAPERPVFVCEADGTQHAYYRVADENISAHPLMVRAWQMRRAPIAATIGARHAKVLDFIRTNPMSDERAVALALHIPVAAAEECIAELAALDMLAFKYDGSHFRLIIKQ